MGWSLHRRRSARRAGAGPRLGAAVMLFGILLHVAAAAQPLVKRLDRYPVTVEYFPEDKKVADKVAAICRHAIPELAHELGLTSISGFRVLLIADMERFQAQQGIRLPSWGVAFALMDGQIMLVDVERATSAWNTLEKVIPHELSHLLVAQRVGGVRMPTWFVEGLALWQAHEWSLLEHWRLMESVWANRAPGLGQIVSSLPEAEGRARDAYRVAYTGFTERFGKEVDTLPLFLGEVIREGDFSAAFERFWSENEHLFYARFDRSLQRRYQSWLLLFQTGPLFSIVAVLFLFVFLRVKLRERRKLKRLERMERGLAVDGWPSAGGREQ
ncbi:MAG: hypothetical protein ACE5EO_03905 [Candidatus Krumholzibacteriia bacterium]